ncbi:MAG: hypothetical protein HQL20_01955 [Candidatus Omnitrophica bacterium]|nr:hypothetical protein [Candidatus Omnitrophota bacterium]
MGGNLLKRFVCTVTLMAFVATSVPVAYAQTLVLPAPGAMVALSPSSTPAVLQGLKVYPNNPFRLDFILDKGDEVASTLPAATLLTTEETSRRLIKYFLAALTTPEKDLWVNLSPYEKDRIIPDAFGRTEMGRDLLAQDYFLKQMTASVIYPEGETGKNFWAQVYKQVQAKYGTIDIPVDTFNKVWIMPAKAIVYENAKAGTAYVVESRLKVMLEADYLAQERNVNTPAGLTEPGTPRPTRFARELAASGGDKLRPYAHETMNHEVVSEEHRESMSVGADLVSARQSNDNLYQERGFVSPSRLPTSQPPNVKATQVSTPTPNEPNNRNDPNEITRNVLREIVIPVLEKEVNEGANFALLRQVYQSLILATWYKKKIKDSILAQVYVDQNKVDGVDIKDAKESEKIWAQYVEAFKKGAYNLIKEEYDSAAQEMIPRKYFSGGIAFGSDMAAVIETPKSFQWLSRLRNKALTLVVCGFTAIGAFTNTQLYAGAYRPLEIQITLENKDLERDLNRQFSEFNYKDRAIHDVLKKIYFASNSSASDRQQAATILIMIFANHNIDTEDIGEVAGIFKQIIAGENEDLKTLTISQVFQYISTFYVDSKQLENVTDYFVKFGLPPASELVEIVSHMSVKNYLQVLSSIALYFDSKFDTRHLSLAPWVDEDDVYLMRSLMEYQKRKSVMTVVEEKQAWASLSTIVERTVMEGPIKPEWVEGMRSFLKDPTIKALFLDRTAGDKDLGVRLNWVRILNSQITGGGLDTSDLDLILSNPVYLQATRAANLSAANMLSVARAIVWLSQQYRVPLKPALVVELVPWVLKVNARYEAYPVIDKDTFVVILLHEQPHFLAKNITDIVERYGAQYKVFKGVLNKEELQRIVLENRKVLLWENGHGLEKAFYLSSRELGAVYGSKLVENVVDGEAILKRLEAERILRPRGFELDIRDISSNLSFDHVRRVVGNKQAFQKIWPILKKAHESLESLSVSNVLSYKELAGIQKAHTTAYPKGQFDVINDSCYSGICVAATIGELRSFSSVMIAANRDLAHPGLVRGISGLSRSSASSVLTIGELKVARDLWDRHKQAGMFFLPNSPDERRELDKIMGHGPKVNAIDVISGDLPHTKEKPKQVVPIPLALGIQPSSVWLAVPDLERKDAAGSADASAQGHGRYIEDILELYKEDLSRHGFRGFSSLEVQDQELVFLNEYGSMSDEAFGNALRSFISEGQSVFALMADLLNEPDDMNLLGDAIRLMMDHPQDYLFELLVKPAQNMAMAKLAFSTFYPERTSSDEMARQMASYIEQVTKNLRQQAFTRELLRRWNSLLVVPAISKRIGSLDQAANGESRQDPAKSGGIDLTTNSVEVQGADQAGIQFSLDPAQMRELQNASGLTPMIMGIKTLNDLAQFLGVLNPAN